MSLERKNLLRPRHTIPGRSTRLPRYGCAAGAVHVQPHPRDTVVVPRKVKSPATLRATRDMVQIIFQSISTLGIVLALL